MVLHHSRSRQDLIEADRSAAMPMENSEVDLGNSTEAAGCVALIKLVLESLYARYVKNEQERGTIRCSLGTKLKLDEARN